MTPPHVSPVEELLSSGNFVAHPKTLRQFAVGASGLVSLPLSALAGTGNAFSVLYTGVAASGGCRGHAGLQSKQILVGIRRPLPKCQIMERQFTGT